jgi:hypothetical protein
MGNGTHSTRSRLVLSQSSLRSRFTVPSSTLSLTSSRCPVHATSQPSVDTWTVLLSPMRFSTPTADLVVHPGSIRIASDRSIVVPFQTLGEFKGLQVLQGPLLADA